MLWQTDKNELGDKRLSPEETVIREREELLTMASTRKIGGQAELEDPMRAYGPRLQFTEIVSRLRRLNPALKFLEGTAGNLALYLPKKRNEYDEAEHVAYDGAGMPKILDPFFWHHKYVGGIPKTELPEYGYVTLDSSNLPVREIRSWRSVLIALIKSGAITYKQAVTEFGEAVGPRSNRWHEQLRNYRNGRQS